MSGLRVSTLRGATSGTSPTFPDGAVVTGVITSTSFSGNLTGNATGNVVGNITGDVAGNITGTAGTFSGNVSVSGTLTYDDVTNIDSVGIITARSGIKIGAGQSVSAVSGIATYYGDGSQLSGVESGVSNFVASGTITNGQTVIVTADGKVKAVSAVTQSVGSATVFESANLSWIGSTFDSSNNKVVVAYMDDDNSDYGTAVVGTVSGTSITFGTPVVFTSSAITYTAVAFDSSNNKVVIAYSDVGGGNNYVGKAIVGTVSGTSISFGSAVTYASAVTAMPSVTFDSSNNKIVIAFRDNGNSYYGTAIVGTVSGTSISFGSEVVFESANVTYPDITFDSTNNKVVIAYRDGGNSNYGTAIVGTVSGTSISFGTATVFESATTDQISATFDSNAGKVVIAYSDNGDSDKGKAIIGTVSGTSISFGSVVVFDSAAIFDKKAVYDSNAGKVVIAYKDGGNSGGGYNYGRLIVGTVSGTSISFGTSVLFESAASDKVSAVYDSTNSKVVIAYRDEGNSNYGTAIVFQNASTNLTTSNYTGIAAEAIADGATGKVTILGGVNTGQTGLTTAQTYYIQNNGSLATSAGSPSVVAGTSISDTKVLVWKS